MAPKSAALGRTRARVAVSETDLTKILLSINQAFEIPSSKELSDPERATIKSLGYPIDYTRFIETVNEILKSKLTTEKDKTKLSEKNWENLAKLLQNANVTTNFIPETLPRIKLVVPPSHKLVAKSHKPQQVSSTPPMDIWDIWQIKVLQSKGYQDQVKRYVAQSPLLSKFVNVNSEPGEILVLLNREQVKKKFKEDYVQNDVKPNMRYMDRVALARVASIADELHIPVKLKVTNKFVNDANELVDDIKRKWQYVLVVDWDLYKMYKGHENGVNVLTENEYNNLNTFYETYYDNLKATGFQSYEYDVEQTKDELKTHLIDTVEILSWKFIQSGEKPKPFTKTPPNRMSLKQVREGFKMADTIHDFGMTEHMKTYVKQALMSMVDKQMEYYLDTERTDALEIIASVYNSTQLSSFDDSYISAVESALLSKPGDYPILYTSDIEECRTRVCSRVIQEVKNWDHIKQQQLLDILADNEIGKTKAFVNQGAYGQLLPTTLKAFSAALRFEGGIQGTYVDNDTEYGFHESELMYFKGLVVKDGYVYVFDNTNDPHRMRYTWNIRENSKSTVNICIPTKTKQGKALTDQYMGSYFDKCLTMSIKDPIQQTLAYYDLKRVADSIGIKAALHHRGVFVTHDNMATLGARLYGCPVISTSGADRGSIVTYHPQAVHNFNIVSEREHHFEDPITPEQSTPLNNHVSKVVSAMEVFREVASRKRSRENAPSPSAQSFSASPTEPSPKRPTFVSTFVAHAADELEMYKLKRRLNELEQERAYHKMVMQKVQEQCPSFDESKVDIDMEGGNTIEEPTRLLVGSLVELLVFYSTKSDLVLKIQEKTIKSMENSHQPILNAAELLNIQTRATNQLNKLYATKFGIRTPLDHAQKIIGDPVLSYRTPFDRAYYNRLSTALMGPKILGDSGATISMGSKNKVRNGTKSASLKKPVNVSVQTKSYITPKSAPAATQVAKPQSVATSKRAVLPQMTQVTKPQNVATSKKAVLPRAEAVGLTVGM